MLKWRCVLITKSGRKFVVRGFDYQEYIDAKNELNETIRLFSSNSGGYLSISNTSFRVQISVSELDCIVWRKTLFGW